MTQTSFTGPKISSGEDAAGRRGQTTTLPDLGAWADLPFFAQTWPLVAQALRDEARVVFPPEPLRFAALQRTQPEETKVVILGQDPYPTKGHANGLAFSVAPDVPLPRSLKNIYRELHKSWQHSMQLRAPLFCGADTPRSSAHNFQTIT